MVGDNNSGNDGISINKKGPSNKIHFLLMLLALFLWNGTNRS